MNIRESGSIDILRVIVHVIDHQQHTQAEKSQSEINVSNMDSKVKTFITDHIRASIKNNESKLAKFESRKTFTQKAINGIIQDPDSNFVSNSKDIADILYSVTPASAAPGCIVITYYTNSIETLVAIIKLDNNDAISYETNSSGTYELVLKGTALPLPSKSNKLQKCAIIRDTDTISEQEWETKPGLIVLDKQVSNFSLFFYQDFLKAQFLLTDSHKSEKLMDGVIKYLKITPLEHNQKHVVLQSFGSKIINGEEFTLDEAARQIFSPYISSQEEMDRVIEQLETIVLEQGIGDTSLKGVVTPRIEKVLGIHKIKTLENIQLSIPSEYMDTKVTIKPSQYGDGSDIFIKDVKIKN
ncbi:hypothetical protein [Peribacillus frigoritolerans]|uniref:hypothetical protein n=1 Tax=Peribacillus frigoritolerans TaxID=450367 RepID=UPI0039A35CE5